MIENPLFICLNIIVLLAYESLKYILDILNAVAYKINSGECRLDHIRVVVNDSVCTIKTKSENIFCSLFVYTDISLLISVCMFKLCRHLTIGGWIVCVCLQTSHYRWVDCMCKFADITLLVGGLYIYLQTTHYRWVDCMCMFADISLRC